MSFDRILHSIKNYCFKYTAVWPRLFYSAKLNDNGNGFLS